MTTELVLLLALFAFVTGPVFFRDNGPIKVFERTAPYLGARLERETATGRGFQVDGRTNEWQQPNP